MRHWWITLAFAISVAAGAQTAPIDASENPWSLTGPAAVGRELFTNSEFVALEKLASRMLTNLLSR